MTTNNKPSLRTRLTAKQEAFCLNYFILRNATQSAIKAGYSPHLIDTNSNHLLENTRIKARLAELEANRPPDPDIADKIERQKRLTAFIRADLVDFITPEGIKVEKKSPNVGAVAELTTRTKVFRKGGEPVNITTIKLQNPITAIDILNKMDRMYSENISPPTEVINNFVFVLPNGTKVTPRALIERVNGNSNQDQDD